MKSIQILVAVAIVFSSCIRPTDVKVNQDMDIEQLINLIDRQPTEILGHTVNKMIQVGDTIEHKSLLIDSSFFKYDFSLFDGKDPKLILLGGRFGKVSEADTITYSRIKGETKGPLLVKMVKNDSGSISYVGIINYEENQLYQSGSNMAFHFVNEKLASYGIKGFQKLPGMEPTSFAIRGEVVTN